MKLVDFLEEFADGNGAKGQMPSQLKGADIQAFELSAYEQGYKAGWEDALQSQNNSIDAISAEFAQNLKDLSFTYHEAYTHVLRSLEPLFEQISKTLLPVILHESLGMQVSDVLMRQGRRIAPMSAEIAVSPSQLAVVEPLVAHDFGFPVTVAEDGSLKEGQADIRLGAVEEHIDLSEIVDGIRAAIVSFSRENRRAVMNG